VIKVNALRTAKAIAAANNGQEPRKIRFHPLVLGRAAILGGFFFFSILIVNHVTRPKIIIDKHQAPPYPRPVEVAKEMGSKAGKSSVQNGKWYARIVVLIIKNNKVRNMTDPPLPTA